MTIKQSKYIDDNGRLVMTRLARRDQTDGRSFDIEFWQSLTDTDRMNGMWELVEFTHKLKGGDPSELRLQRSIAKLKRRRG